ncbi:MAG: hypothetical protein WBE08_13385, partial [Methyloceanibacter sp.]
MAPRLIARGRGDWLIDAAQDLDGVVEVEQDRILDPSRFLMHHLGEAAADEQLADASQIAGHIGEAET